MIEGACSSLPPPPLSPSLTRRRARGAQDLAKFYPILSVLSIHPWLSSSQMRASGQTVCFKSLHVGLSDGMNLFATEQTVRANPSSSPVVRTTRLLLFFFLLFFFRLCVQRAVGK